MKNKLDFSLILPCYNESEHFSDSMDRILDVLDNSRLSFEIILIDDKSSDDTSKLIKSYLKKKNRKEISAYFHKKNVGRGGTVTDGLKKSKGKYVGFIDIDLEVAPDYIPQIISEMKKVDCDVIVGRRHYPLSLWPPEVFLRLILSKGYAFLVNLMLFLPISDSESGYKFFKRDPVLQVLKKTKNKHWFWDTEILARSYMEGLKVREYPVLFLRRSDKTSTVNIVPDTIDYFKEVTSFKNQIQDETNKQNMGLLYKFPFIYTLAMKFLYKDSYDDSYKKIANLIENDSTVVDVCCGDAKLKSFLKDKTAYMGVDGNPSFFYSLLKKNIYVKLTDAEDDPIPEADYVVLQRSLYQFKNPGKVVSKLYKSAKKALIISESVHNLKEEKSSSIISNYIPKFVATRNKNPHFRFNESGFKKLLAKYHPKYVKIKCGRDLIAVINK